MLSEKRFEFIDYINGGEELQLVTAIDFTGSNGVPRFKESLHYNDPYGKLNHY